MVLFALCDLIALKELPKPERTALKKVQRLIKATMSAVSLALYIFKEEILILVSDLIKVLETYSSDAVLTERFVADVQEVIASLYYSHFAHRITTENIVNVLDICLRTGWRNLVCPPVAVLPSLQDYLKSGPKAGRRLLCNQSEAEFRETETSVDRACAQLAFPGGEPTRQVTEAIDRKSQDAVTDSESRFRFLSDAEPAMQAIVENILRMFLTLGRPVRAATLQYITRIVSLELRNTQSPIASQSMLLAELCDWYSCGAVERAGPKTLHAGGKLWVLNEYSLFDNLVA